MNYFSSLANYIQTTAQKAVQTYLTPPPPQGNEKDTLISASSSSKKVAEKEIKYFTIDDFEQMKREAEDFDTYQILYDEEHMKLWIKSKGEGSEGFKRHKYQGTIPYNIETVLATLRDYRFRQEWDVRDLGREIIEIVPANPEKKQPINVVERTTKKGVSVAFNDRDLVMLNSIHRETITDKHGVQKTRILMLSKSVVHPKAPEQEGFIRAEMVYQGMIFEQGQDLKKCNYWSICEIDPKGWVYSSLYNWAIRVIPQEFEQTVSRGCQKRIERGLKDDDFNDYYQCSLSSAASKTPTSTSTPFKPASLT